MHSTSEEDGHPCIYVLSCGGAHLQVGGEVGSPRHLDDNCLAVIAVADQLSLGLLRQLRLLHCLEGGHVCAMESICGPAAPPSALQCPCHAQTHNQGCGCNTGHADALCLARKACQPYKAAAQPEMELCAEEEVCGRAAVGGGQKTPESRPSTAAHHT